MNSADNQNTLAGKKIGFFGKGGAGKSTTVVLSHVLGREELRPLLLGVTRQ